jgi:hypothetical protein
MNSHGTPPSPHEMARLDQLHGSFDWIDIIHWQDAVGLRHGILFDEDTGRVTFMQGLLPPQEELIAEFTDSVSMQMHFP